MKFTKYWLPVILWAVVIFLFSALTVEPSPEFDFQDFLIKKTAHLVEYAILFTLTYRALTNTTEFDKKNSVILALLFILVYAASDEFHQSFTPGRTPSIRDIVIDITGASFAWLGIWKLLPKAPKKLTNWAKTLEIN